MFDPIFYEDSYFTDYNRPGADNGGDPAGALSGGTGAPAPDISVLTSQTPQPLAPTLQVSPQPPAPTGGGLAHRVLSGALAGLQGLGAGAQASQQVGTNRLGALGAGFNAARQQVQQQQQQQVQQGQEKQKFTAEQDRTHALIAEANANTAKLMFDLGQSKNKANYDRLQKQAEQLSEGNDVIGVFGQDQLTQAMKADPSFSHEYTAVPTEDADGNPAWMVYKPVSSKIENQAQADIINASPDKPHDFKVGDDLGGGPVGGALKHRLMVSGMAEQHRQDEETKLKGQNKPESATAIKERRADLDQQLSEGTIGPGDRRWLAGQQREDKYNSIPTEITSQLGRPPVPADFRGGENDPAYKAANAAWGRKAQQMKEDEAAVRGASYAKARGVAVGIPNDDGTYSISYVPAGEAEAKGYPTAEAAQLTNQREAQFGDVRTGLQNLRAAIQADAGDSWSPDQVAKLREALGENDPTRLNTQIEALAASGLTDKQKDLVTWLEQTQERVLGMRQIAGMGQASETTRRAMLNAIPSITSGSQDMALRQLDATGNMIDNLHRGLIRLPTSAETQQHKGPSSLPDKPPPPQPGEQTATGPNGQKAVLRKGQWQIIQ